jgi:hypothetical protein
VQRLKLGIARKFLLARGERPASTAGKPEADLTLPLSDAVFAYLLAAAIAALRRQCPTLEIYPA